MTVDECMAKATTVIDEVIAAAMDHGIRMISDKGATEEEVADFRRWYGALMAQDRATNLAKLRSWLGRGVSRCNET